MRETKSQCCHIPLCRQIAAWADPKAPGVRGASAATKKRDSVKEAHLARNRGAANSYATSRVCCEQTLDGFGSALQSMDDGQASIQARAATDLSQDMA
eukprot:1804565-Rhodomonas_salina.1